MNSAQAIVASYRGSFFVQLYVRIRMWILGRRFLDEIAQYLPEDGNVLDVGCGFGLAALLFAISKPRRRIKGFDVSPSRIETARRAAERLGLTNATFEVAHVESARIAEPFDAAYMIDLVHHVPKEAVEPLVASIARNLRPDGTLLIKDLATRPRHLAFNAWLLDKVMYRGAPIHQWPVEELRALLQRHFKTVHVHALADVLPFPDVLYICRK